MKAWREADDARLTRLEDEARLASLWRGLAGEDAPLPHPRAAGLFVCLRRSTEGALAIERADRGELAPLLRAVTQPDPAALSPALAHHLALLHGGLADATGAERARIRSLGMWLFLATEQTYLLQVGQAVAQDALPAREVERATTEAPFGPIDGLGAEALAGARELTDRAAAALRVLGRVEEACALGRADEAVTRKAVARARRARAAAVDAAVARVDGSLEEAITRDAPTDELVALLWDAVAVWRWADADEQVERFLVQRVTSVLWDRYRDRRWDDVRALLRPLSEPTESLARRIERDPSKLAYAAPCAQMYVFSAEVAPTLEEQLRDAERAVALCPTHRNGSLILADLLVHRAMRALDTVSPWNQAETLDRAEADVRRAESLYPQLKRLPDAKLRLEAKGRKIDGG